MADPSCSTVYRRAMSDAHRPPIDAVASLLRAEHGQEPTGLAPIDGGFWSSAYSYEIGNDSLVLRLATDSDGYLADRAAQRFGGPDLPIPEVLAIGEAFDGAFAISRRSIGRFLEDVLAHESSTAGPMLERLLGALRVASREQAGVWPCPPAVPATSWQSWLEDLLLDDPQRTVSGWRSQLRERPRLDRLFAATTDRVQSLLPACPERHDLVHGDLLHQNVLVSSDASFVNAVFSWKCSVLGDFLYDVAWCTFWGPWHPGIEAIHIFDRTVAAAIDEADLVDASERHHCYELHIGAQHLAWCAWIEDWAELDAVATQLTRVLESGPRRIL